MELLYRASRGKQKHDSIQPRSHAEPHFQVNEPTILVFFFFFFLARLKRRASNRIL